MNRKNFLINAMMALAVSLVPKILRPLLPDIQEEEMVDVPITMNYVKFMAGTDQYAKVGYEYAPEAPKVWIMRMTKSNANTLVAEYHSRKNS